MCILYAQNIPLVSCFWQHSIHKTYTINYIRAGEPGDKKKSLSKWLYVKIARTLLSMPRSPQLWISSQDFERHDGVFKNIRSSKQYLSSF